MASVDGVQSSDLMDPFHHFSALSLFPRAFKDLKTNFSIDSGVNFIHESMKLKDLKSPNKLSEQANSIIDGVSELLNTNFAGVGPGEKLNDARYGNPRDRRPGLGLKRPRFSLRPNISQPAACLEPSLNIDQLEDPEEYFLACEKLENVRKELKSQKGPDLHILDESNPLRAEQRRRPGLLGKSINYKHLGPFTSYGKDNKSVASQETLEQDLFCSDHSSPEKQLLSVKPGKETSSVQLTGPKADDLLNELLSDKYENMDGNGALSFLQEHLQIKPIDIETLSLPAFPVVGNCDFIDVKGKLKKPKKVLSDIQNILKSVGVKTPMKDKPVAGSPITSTASSTPPKSPFASIFLMKNTSLKSSEKSHDTLMSFEPLPSKNISHIEQFDQRSNQFDSMKDVSDLDIMEASQNEHAEITVDNRSSPEIITCNSRRLSNKCLEMEDTDHARRVDNESILITPNDMQENAEDVPQDPLIQCSHDANVTKDSPMICTNEQTEDVPQEPLIQCSHDANVTMDSPMICTNEQTEDVPQEPLIQCSHDANVTKDSPMICTNEQTEGLNEVRENVENQSYDTVLDASMDLPTSGTSKSGGAQSGKLSSAAVFLHGTEEPVKSPVKVAGQVSKKKNIEGVKGTRRTSKRLAANGGHITKNAFSGWQSLADAGTSWTSGGVRRSNRIKMRPLEYWKGERFLYGRMHKSGLPSVIGIKYISPAKGGGGEDSEKPTFRVKSFSDEYRELVELAALH